MPAAFIASTPDPLAGLRETLVGHGFTVGQVIYADANDSWALGQSDVAATLATDIVAEVTDADNFRRAFDGESIGGFTGLVVGSGYGDSSTVAGAIAEFDSQTGMAPGALVSNVIGYAESATELTFRKERAIQI